MAITQAAALPPGVADALAVLAVLPIDADGKIGPLLPAYGSPLPDITIEQWAANARRATVDIGDLLGHHDRIRAERVEWHLRHVGDPAAYGDMMCDGPVVVKVDADSPVVADGDHRVSALKLLGVDTVDVWMLDIADLN